MISYRLVPISSQKGVLFLRHPVDFHDIEKQPYQCLKFFGKATLHSDPEYKPPN